MSVVLLASFEIITVDDLIQDSVVADIVVSVLILVLAFPQSP